MINLLIYSKLTLKNEPRHERKLYSVIFFIKLSFYQP